MRFTCAYCGKKAEKEPSAVNRARKAGLNLYCNRRCSGFGRRLGKTKAQLKEEKRLYDIDYRNKNRVRLLAEKKARHKRTYDPAKARVERKKRAKWHLEYCRRPEIGR